VETADEATRAAVDVTQDHDPVVAVIADDPVVAMILRVAPVAVIVDDPVVAMILRAAPVAVIVGVPVAAVIADGRVAIVGVPAAIRPDARSRTHLAAALPMGERIGR
jgi:hypothetical protein